MPDGKYYDRPGMGNGKFNLGWDEEDLPSKAPAPAMNTPSSKPPTEATQDKEMRADGNKGTPWATTLKGRRGRPDSGSGFKSAGGYGGPEAQ